MVTLSVIVWELARWAETDSLRFPVSAEAAWRCWEWSQDYKCGTDALPGAIAPALSSQPPPVFLLYVIYLGLGISFYLH